MKPTNITPASGRVLISEPALNDKYFNRAVVLLADHSAQGSFGLIINKPLEVKVNGLLKDFPDFNAKVFLGGPVNTSHLFFLHNRGDFIRNSRPIKEGLFWGGEIEDVKSLIQLGGISAHDIRFYVGYSAWAEHQLNEELKEFSWLVGQPNIMELIDMPASKMWKYSVADLGEDYRFWANFPNDPSLN